MVRRWLCLFSFLYPNRIHISYRKLIGRSSNTSPSSNRIPEVFVFPENFLLFPTQEPSANSFTTYFSSQCAVVKPVHHIQNVSFRIVKRSVFVLTYLKKEGEVCGSDRRTYKHSCDKTKAQNSKSIQSGLNFYNLNYLKSNSDKDLGASKSVLDQSC